MGVAMLEPSLPLWMLDTMNAPKWQQGTTLFCLSFLLTVTKCSSEYVSYNPTLWSSVEAVTLSNANVRTLYVAWKTARYKIFKLNNDANLLYTQYCLVFCL